MRQLAMVQMLDATRGDLFACVTEQRDAHIIRAEEAVPYADTCVGKFAHGVLWFGGFHEVEGISLLADESLTFVACEEVFRSSTFPCMQCGGDTMRTRIGRHSCLKCEFVIDVT